MIQIMNKVLKMSISLTVIAIFLNFLSLRNKIITKNNVLKDKQIEKILYPELLSCLNYYDNSILNETIRNNYSIEADIRLHESRIVRSIILYYPIDNHVTFKHEFRWLYFSWIEMQKYEPNRWRTDLILFLDDKILNSNNDSKHFFKDLDCKIENRRHSKEDKPMCTIIDYIPISKRITKHNVTYLKSIDPLILFSHLYKDINIFDDNDLNIWKFHAILKDLSHYVYVDSVMMAFEGYKYFQNKYDFVIRSDMDVFLTPLFAKWLPLNCNDFLTGGGGYSENFNMKRIKKAAQNVNLKSGNVRNLGSTWYSTPHQFRIVSYLTLVSMIYLSNEEFSSTERKGKLGTGNWPEWYYGVILLYGQTLAMNHLISLGVMNIKKLENLIDFPSNTEELVSSKVHIHVFHDNVLFSKWKFKSGGYDNMTLPISNSHLVKYYCLNIALESKRKSLNELKTLGKKVIENKI
jgi:hypothetical protein